MKIKSKCCDKYKRKARACAGCPVMVLLSKKHRKKKFKKIRQNLKKAA